jgi:hypothetical protein
MVESTSLNEEPRQEQVLSEIISAEKINVQDAEGNTQMLYQYTVVSTKALSMGICNLYQ